jgi:hypothetical protein
VIQLFVWNNWVSLKREEIQELKNRLWTQNNNNENIGRGTAI